MMLISQGNKQAMRNPWVLGWLGLLITVLAVNVAFIVTAFKTNPGLVDKNYYEKGRAVEEHFQERLKARNRLGWDINVQTPSEVVAGKATTFHVNIVDKVGMPLNGAEVTMQAYRPSDASADIKINMDFVTNGIYQARFALPLKGIWDLKVNVTRGDDELNISRRIHVQVP